MISLSLVWLLVLPFVPLVLRVRRKRWALFWIVLTYGILVFSTAIIPSFLELYMSGAGDPDMVAGQIAQKLVTSMLVGLFVVPSALLAFWMSRRFVFQ